MVEAAAMPTSQEPWPALQRPPTCDELSVRTGRQSWEEAVVFSNTSTTTDF